MSCTVLMQGALDTLLPGEAGGEGVDGEGYGGRSFGDRVFGNPLGKGTIKAHNRATKVHY